MNVQQEPEELRTTVLCRTMSDVDVCRKMGWIEGTRLVGDEGFGPSVIEITSLRPGGDILGRRVEWNGKPVDEREASWTLSNRDWSVSVQQEQGEEK